jgi:hypothetical protein
VPAEVTAVPDLFTEIDPTAISGDPRRVAMLERDDVAKEPPKVSTVDDIQRIMISVIKAHMPPEEEILKYRGSGWDQPDCHRWRFEDGEFHVEGILNATPRPPSEGLFRWSCDQRLRGDNLGTFHATLKQTQGNGLWVPVEIAFRADRVPKMDGTRSAKFVSPDPEGIILLPDRPQWLTTVPIATSVLKYRIRWVDARNAPDLKYDTEGKPIPDVAVKVTQTTDPAVMGLLEHLAARTGGGDNADTASALNRLANAIEADRVSREEAALDNATKPKR